MSILLIFPATSSFQSSEPFHSLAKYLVENNLKIHIAWYNRRTLIFDVKIIVLGGGLNLYDSNLSI